ncbi:MAG: filamentous hemagglutinin N-terminal domain-containing protein, partial [Sulfuricellaceae bacterium]|nr:filamentous hemagglutinin N-terminal domain-containing protein [Sulfuricellaceae bacterium]
MKRHASLSRIDGLVRGQIHQSRLVVAEKSKRQGKAASAPILIAAALALTTALAHAAPTGGQISAGTGNVTQAGATTTVTQHTQNLAIDWNSFSIGSNEAVVFKQPSAASIALNRVLGQNPSRIFGSLTANGQVFILNPNGVLFGPGAQVNAGGLVASTLGLSDADFLAGNYRFSNTGGQASVINQGKLSAANGGYIALLGPEVRNEGAIVTTLGTALLAAGGKVRLYLDNGSLLSYTIDQGALNALAENKQLIQADGGQVILSANALNALTRSVVNNTGIIEAHSIQSQGGVIRLEGDGEVGVSGTLDASGRSSGETGGTVKVLGDRVALLDGARIDVSGDAGGGTALIGGNYQGKGTEQNASSTFVATGAQVKADALSKGNGGKLVVWADDATRVYSSLSAKGGAQSGNGGFIETSGKRYLDVTQAADASAAHGTGGSWLLDPNNITIQTAGSNTNVTASPFFTSTNDNAIVTTGSIQTALNQGTSVIVTTGTGGTNSQAGDISVANAIAKTAGSDATLTLNASHDITFSTGANVTSTAGALNLTLNAPGAVNTLQNISLLGGTLTLNATGNATQSGTIQGSTAVVKDGAGTLTLSTANTYTGATSINEGTLQLGADNRIADTSALTVASGATFNLNGFDDTVGSIAGGGTVTSGAAGAVTLTAGGNGSTTLFSGTLQNGSGTLALTKTGTGMLVLSGANTYTGVTTVSSGVVRVQSNTALGTTAGG